jgi:uncharacterized protein (TIGR00297 family)
MNARPARFVAGTIAAAVVALVARRSRALSADGAVAATFVGGAVSGGMGARGGGALVAFFASSTLLGRLPQSSAVQEQRRGNERDAVQVLANGGLAALLALAAELAPATVRPALRAGFGGAIAAAAADTWATEIGSRWGGRPRSLATLQPVAPGASGGVTIAGLAASLVGAACIALILGESRRCWYPSRDGQGPPSLIPDGSLGEALANWGSAVPREPRQSGPMPLSPRTGRGVGVRALAATSPNLPREIPDSTWAARPPGGEVRTTRRHQSDWCFPVSPTAIILGGLTGSLADSLLGATVQEVRWCDRCHRETEHPVHRCGTPTRPLRGHRWCDNDVVNALATAAGALVAIAMNKVLAASADRTRPAPRRRERRTARRGTAPAPRS